MNQLSMLLYLGNVLGNLGPLCAFISVMFILTGVVLTLISVSQRQDMIQMANYTSKEAKERVEAIFKRPLWHPYVFGLLATLFMLLAALCPSSQTVYAIAASQVGEQVLTHDPTAIKARAALNAWLDKQVAEEPKKADN